MPKMGGIEFLQELMSDPQLRPTPVVVMTTSNQDRVEAYNLNVADYLLQPVTLSNFVEIMVALNQYWILYKMP